MFTTSNDAFREEAMSRGADAFVLNGRSTGRNCSRRSNASSDPLPA
jgi:hypothetical protein